MLDNGDVFLCEEDGGIHYVIISNRYSYDKSILAWPVNDSKKLFIILEEKDLTLMKFVGNILSSYPVSWNTDPSDLENFLNSKDSPIKIIVDDITTKQDQLGELV